jgi:hypothetical protein
VPRFILRRFIDGNSGLWELNVTNARHNIKAVDDAGQHLHFYTVELEHGLLEDMDTEAGTLFHRKVYGRDSVRLDEEERTGVAKWLASVILRNPKRFENTKDEVNGYLADPTSALQLVLGNIDDYIEFLKSTVPEVWDAKVAELGIDGARQLVIADAEIRLRRGEAKVIDPKDIFCSTITDVRLEKWAGWMMLMEWTWLRTESQFIIGGDPVCRWSPKHEHIEYGLAHADCEVTVPLSRQFCLRMCHARDRDPQTVKSIDHQTTSRYNNRQLISASKFAYGSRQQIRREAERLKDVAAGRCPLPRGR